MTGLSDEVADALNLLARGLPEIDLPPRETIWDVAATVTIAEGLQVHAAWLRSAGDLYGDDVRALLGSGFEISAVDYLEARQALRILRSTVQKRLALVDAIILPTAPMGPPIRGEAPLALRRHLTGWTRPFNLSDSAVVSIPLPATSSPIGIQIVSNGDSSALSVALHVERLLAEAGRIVALHDEHALVTAPFPLREPR
jgi:Asp-tRNA(Asn)/Glu-tRNA(Gln) amidotransferase A subunit family amidase